MSGLPKHYIIPNPRLDINPNNWDFPNSATIAVQSLSGTKSDQMFMIKVCNSKQAAEQDKV